MVVAMTGWVVSISTLEVGMPDLRLFAVAESDPADAIEAVEKHTSAGDDLHVRIVSPLSPQTEVALGLAPGEVMEITS
jgi:hypothetical protein